jgi:hypothetical protein
VAVLLPSAVVTVMVAIPALMAVTFPVASTMAISSLSLFQMTALFAAFSGDTVVIKLKSSPIATVFAVSLMMIPVTF